jgi:hypothetical protein
MSNIHEQMMTYHQTHPSEILVVKPDNARDMEIWNRWRAYLFRTNNKKTIGTFEYILRHGGKGLTLPTDDPAKMDQAYRAQTSERNRYWDR